MFLFVFVVQNDLLFALLCPCSIVLSALKCTVTCMIIVAISPGVVGVDVQFRYVLSPKKVGKCLVHFEFVFGAHLGHFATFIFIS